MSEPHHHHPRIQSVIWGLFRDAADEDYLIARWSAKHSLFHQFSWSAQQAIEKYLKCALVLNGTSVSRFGHTHLLKMFFLLKSVSGRLLPDLLCPPDFIQDNGLFVFGRFETTERFIGRLEMNGSPDNRYRTSDLFHSYYDLHKLDELVFQLRRLALPLDKEFYHKTKLTNAEFLELNLNYQPAPKFSFQKSHQQSALEKDKIFRWRNFSYFAESARKEGKVSFGTYGRRRFSKGFEKTDDIGVAQFEWVLGMIKHSSYDKAHLEMLLKPHSS